MPHVPGHVETEAERIDRLRQLADGLPDIEAPEGTDIQRLQRLADSIPDEPAPAPVAQDQPTFDPETGQPLRPLGSEEIQAMGRRGVGEFGQAIRARGARAPGAITERIGPFQALSQATGLAQQALPPDSGVTLNPFDLYQQFVAEQFPEPRTPAGQLGRFAADIASFGATELSTPQERRENPLSAGLIDAIIGGAAALPVIGPALRPVVSGAARGIGRGAVGATEAAGTALGRSPIRPGAFAQGVEESAQIAAREGASLAAARVPRGAVPRTFDEAAALARQGGADLGALNREAIEQAVAPTVPDTVTELTRLVREAKPVLAATEAARSAELSRRVAIGGARVAGADPLEAGRLFKSALPGELPTTPTFEAPRTSLSTEQQRGLFARIWDSDKQLFFKNSTNDALEKLLDGGIPQRAEIAKLEEMFGSDLVKAILSKRPLGQKTGEFIVDLANTPRAFQTTADMSAPLRQGIVLAPSHPVRFTQSFGRMFKAFGSEKNARFVDDAITSHPNFQRYQNAGLFHAERRGVGAALNAREEAIMTSLAQRIRGPVGAVIRASERSYVTFLNKLRFDVMDDQVRRWVRGGIPLESPEMAIRMEGWARFVNRATGRGGLGPLEAYGPALNAAFFSPRFVSSRITLPASLFEKNPAVRRAVARDIAAFVGTGTAALGLISLDPDVDVEINPRSSDFGKIRVGQTRVDFWGGFLPLLRFVTQMTTNQRQGLGTGQTTPIDRGDTIKRFVRSKLSPLAGLVPDIATGRTFVGEELEATGRGIANQVFNRLAPLVAQDIAQAVTEQGLVGGALGATAFFGTSTQSFTTVDDIAQRDFAIDGVPLSYPELWPFEKGMTRATLQAERENKGFFEDLFTSTPSPSDYRKRMDEIDALEQTQLQEVAENKIVPPMVRKRTAREAQNAYFTITSDAAVARNERRLATFGQPSGDFAIDDSDPQKVALAQYYQNIDDAKTEKGRLFISEAYNVGLERLRREWTQEQRDYVDANTHIRDVPQDLLAELPPRTRQNILRSQMAREQRLRQSQVEAR